MCGGVSGLSRPPSHEQLAAASPDGDGLTGGALQPRDQAQSHGAAPAGSTALIADDSFAPAVCPRCGVKNGVPNCCSNDGAWAGMCTESLSDGGTHTWREGYRACHGDSATSRYDGSGAAEVPNRDTTRERVEQESYKDASSSNGKHGEGKHHKDEQDKKGEHTKKGEHEEEEVDDKEDKKEKKDQQSKEDAEDMEGEKGEDGEEKADEAYGKKTKSGWVQTCPRCGRASGGSLNCCGGGGTWEKACVVTAVKEGQHTWQDGWDACNDKAEIDKKKAKAEEAKAEAAERNAEQEEALAEEAEEERKAAAKSIEDAQHEAEEAVKKAQAEAEAEAKRVAKEEEKARKEAKRMSDEKEREQMEAEAAEAAAHKANEEDEKKREREVDAEAEKEKEEARIEKETRQAVEAQIKDNQAAAAKVQGAAADRAAKVQGEADERAKKAEGDIKKAGGDRKLWPGRNHCNGVGVECCKTPSGTPYCVGNFVCSGKSNACAMNDAASEKAGAAAAAAEHSSEQEEEKRKKKGKWKMSHWSDIDLLTKMFKQGNASNDLRKIGLTIHCFDDTEGWPAVWRPCNSGWCYRSARWWSASIINSKQRRTFGSSGIIFTPSPTKNRLLCSFTSDSGTLNAGCGRLRNSGFPPNRTEDMMRWSMNWATEYNEVLVDSEMYVKNLPASVAAIVYGLRGGSDGDVEYDKVRAAQTYVALLDEYGLNESQIPFLKATYDPMSNEDEKGPIFVDESASVREFLAEHPFRKYRELWRKRHPYLAAHPNETHAFYVRRDRLAREKREKELARRADARRPLPASQNQSPSPEPSALSARQRLALVYEPVQRSALHRAHSHHGSEAVV